MVETTTRINPISYKNHYKAKKKFCTSQTLTIFVPTPPYWFCGRD